MAGTAEQTSCTWNYWSTRNEGNMYIDGSGIAIWSLLKVNKSGADICQSLSNPLESYAKIFTQTAVICLDNKYIGHIGSNVWSMCKYVNVQQQSMYIFHPEQRYLCVWSVSRIDICTTSFTFCVLHMCTAY